MKWTSIGKKLSSLLKIKCSVSLAYLLIPIGLILLTSWLYQRQGNQENVSHTLSHINAEIRHIDSVVSTYDITQDINFHTWDLKEDFIHLVGNGTRLEYWNYNKLDNRIYRAINTGGKFLIEYNDTTYYFHVIVNGEKVAFIGTPLFDGSNRLLTCSKSKISSTATLSYPLKISKEIIPITTSNLYDYIIINNNEPIQTIPNMWVEICFYLFVLSVLVGFYFFIQDLMKIWNPLFVWTPTAIITTVLLFTSYEYIPIPFNLQLTNLYNPDIFSSLSYWNSVPVVILHVIIIGLLFLLYSINVKTVHYYDIHSPTLRLIAVLLVLFIHVFFFTNYLVPVLHTLIIDSQVSFSFYNFNKVTVLSFVILHLCIFIINILTSIIYSVKQLSRILTKSLLFRTIILIGCICISYIFRINEDISNSEIITTSLLLLSYYLISYWLTFPISSKQETLQNIFTFNGLIWYVLTAVILSIFIYFFNHEKEHNHRIQYASSMVINNDINAEYAYYDHLKTVEKEYKKGYLNNTELFENLISTADSLFPNFNFQSIDFIPAHRLHGEINLLDYKTNNIDSDETSYTKILLEARTYEMIFPVVLDNDTGYIYTKFYIPFDISSKISKMYDQDNLFIKYYTVGIYYNNHLFSKHGTSISKISNYDNYENNTGFYNGLLYSTYIYQSDIGQKIVVIYEKNSIFHFLSKVSYSLLFLLLNTYLFTQLTRIFNYKNTPKTKVKNSFRLNINYGIVASVFLSSVLIAIISILYYRNVNVQNNIESIEKEQNLFENKMNFVIKNTLTNIDSLQHNNISHLYNYIKEISAAESYTVKVFNNNGVRITQDGERYNMNPEAYKVFVNSKQISNNKQSGIFQYFTEGNNVYYQLNIDNKTVGTVLFLPTDVNEKSNNKINTIISVLINVYIFLLIFSIIVSIIVSQKLTANINKLTDQFSKLKLSHNNLIHYHHDDELQPLVDEYNRMIFKVEKMAKDLAIKNREDAWKEVAKQVAHEINNPITPIKLNIQYLIKAAESGKDIQQLFINVSPSILEQIDKLHNIAASFSSLAKMPDPKMKDINIVSLIRNIIKLMEVDTQSIISFHTAQHNLWIHADPDFINIIFINLIKNAYQATEANRNESEIKVKIFVEYKDVLITVADNGHGMNTDTQSKLFSPNFTTKSAGSGIGLFMSRNLILGMQGSIEFISEEHKGTTFYIRFPLIQHMIGHS